MSKKFKFHKFAKENLIYLFIVVYTLIFSVLTIFKHFSFNTHAQDLGIYDQLFWNTLHGNIGYTTLHESVVGGINHFGLHTEPILFILLPMYAVYPSPATLLFLQTFFLAIGTLPVYWLATEKLGSKNYGLGFSAFYLLFPALHGINIYEFHFIAFAVPFLLFAFYYMEKENYGRFILFSILAMMCKEDVPPVVLFLGIYTFFRKGDKIGRRVGISLSIASGIWFLISIKFLMPFFYSNSLGAESTGEPWWLFRYGYLGNTFLGVIGEMLSNPFIVLQHILILPNLKYVIMLFSPVGFLPFLSPVTLLIALPTFAQNLLTTFPPQHSIHSQYSASLIPFLFISTIYGVQKISSEKAIRHLNNILEEVHVKKRVDDRSIKNTITIAILFATLFSNLTFGLLPLSSSEIGRYTIKDHDEIGLRLVKQIPINVSVSTENYLIPHLSNRNEIYRFPLRATDEVVNYTIAYRDITKPSRGIIIGEINYRASEEDMVDYILLDTTRYLGPLSRGEYTYYVRIVLRGGYYGVIEAKEGYLLLKKGSQDRVDFFTFFGDNWYNREVLEGAPIQWMENNASLEIHTSKPSDITLSFNALSFHRDRVLEISINNDHLISHLIDTRGKGVRVNGIRIPSGKSVIRFYIPQRCERPSELGINRDDRCLSIGFQNLKISPKN